jgi:hypothetical protein
MNKGGDTMVANFPRVDRRKLHLSPLVTSFVIEFLGSQGALKLEQVKKARDGGTDQWDTTHVWFMYQEMCFLNLFC